MLISVVILKLLRPNRARSVLLCRVVRNVIVCLTIRVPRSILVVLSLAFGLAKRVIG